VVQGPRVCSWVCMWEPLYMCVCMCEFLSRYVCVCAGLGCVATILSCQQGQGPCAGFMSPNLPTRQRRGQRL
jgi:hypothetical protein